MSQRENGLISGGCRALARLDGIGFCLFRAGKGKRESVQSVNKMKGLDKARIVTERDRCGGIIGK